MGGEKPSLMLVLVKVCILISSNTVFFIQGVPGGMCNTSGECSLC